MSVKLFLQSDASGFGSNHHDQVTPLHFGGLLHNHFVFEVFLDALQDLHSLVGISDFPSSKQNGDLGLVLLAQKTPDVLDLRQQVMLVRLGTNLDLLNLDDRLFLLGFLAPFALLILELPVVHDFTDWGSGVRSDFHQVELILCRQLQGFLQRQHAQLLTLATDESNFWRSNFLIDVDLLLQILASFPDLHLNSGNPQANPPFGGLEAFLLDHGDKAFGTHQIKL